MVSALSRRSFLRGLGAGLAAMGAVVIAAFRIRDAVVTSVAPSSDAAPAPADDLLAALHARLERAFPYLRIPVETSARFLEAMQAHWTEDSRKDGRSRPVEQAFLLSTDFFRHGMDEARPLQFVALFDPYVSPCYQPLARGEIEER